MAAKFDREQLLEALDEVGRAAIAANDAAGHRGLWRLRADAGEQFSLRHRRRGHRRTW